MQRSELYLHLWGWRGAKHSLSHTQTLKHTSYTLSAHQPHTQKLKKSLFLHRKLFSCIIRVSECQSGESLESSHCVKLYNVRLETLPLCLCSACLGERTTPKYAVTYATQPSHLRQSDRADHKIDLRMRESSRRFPRALGRGRARAQSSFRCCV